MEAMMMESNEFLPLMTLGAIAPYVLEALLYRIRRAFRSGIGAHAPAWLHLQKNRSHAA